MCYYMSNSEKRVEGTLNHSPTIRNQLPATHFSVRKISYCHQRFHRKQIGIHVAQSARKSTTGVGLMFPFTMHEIIGYFLEQIQSKTSM